MTPTEIGERLKSAFSEKIIDVKPGGEAKVSPASIRELAKFLRDELQFDYLMCLSGMDYGKNVLGVVYNIASVSTKVKYTLKLEVPADNPDVPSVFEIWPSANWHEREAYDLFGIRFADHPDLRRILLPDDWEGFPLRKDYKLPEFYQGMKVPY